MNDKNNIIAIIEVYIAKYLHDVIHSYNNDLSSSDDDNDDDIVIAMNSTRMSRGRATRVLFYVNDIIPNYTNSQFKMHFRLTRIAFENILQIIGPYLKNQQVYGRPTIDPQTQLLAVIWLMATPDSYRSVGDRFDLSKSSLHHCFLRIVHVLNKIAPSVIQWPKDEYALRVKQGFSKTGIHNIIGSIDGAYIHIKAPIENPETYICRKKFHAVTLQAVCDHKLYFTDCFVGYPSSVNDYRIFKNSDLYKGIINNHMNYFPYDEFIIGDKAYPVREWCIAPYLNRGILTARQKRFNEALSGVRQNIERAFALLKGRFRRMKYLDMSRTDLIPATILSCCVLHNLCLRNGDFDQNFLEEGLEAEEDNEENNENINQIFDEDEAGMLRRDRIALNL